MTTTDHRPGHHLAQLHYAEHGFLLAPPLARDLDVEFYIESSAYHRTDTRWTLRSP